MIDLIDDLKTIENFKRMQRDQWAEYRGQFRYLYIWDRQAAFSCNGEFLHFLQHIQSKRVHTKERRTYFSTPMHTPFQALSGLPPSRHIDGGQIGGGDRGQAGQRGGEDGAAHDQAGRDWGGGAPISLRPVVRRSW